MKGIICYGINLAAVAWLAALPVAAQPPSAPPPAANQSALIPMDQLGAVASKQYHGDGLSVTATPDGARLRCAFQRLEGEVTRDGLWLRSTAENAPGERLRVMAVEVGRTENFGVRRQSAAATPLFLGEWMQMATPDSESGVALCFPPQSMTLPIQGAVLVNGQTVRFIRPGLTEEYSVSVDGVRQDFVVEERPGGEGELRVELDVTGARAEPLVNGVRLVLDGSGRKLAYNRLRVTDATGRELPARMEVAAGVSPAMAGGILPPGRIARTAGMSGFNCDEFAISGLSAGLEARALRQAKMPAATTLAVLVDDASAIYPVRIDPTFSDANWISMSGLPGADSSVHAAVVDGSGNLYIGGGFTVVGDLTAHYIAKWDGSSWSPLGSGMDKTVFALAVSGSDLYAGGDFTTAGGTVANRIAKWNGSSWSAPGSGVNSRVRALTVLGSDLYAAGEFTTAGDNDAAAYVAKWDGTNWSALGSGVNSPAYSLVASGSDLYAGGTFTHATNSGGVAVTVNGIAKWNGTNWSALGLGMAGLDITVYALAVSGTNVYAGGAFTIAGGSAMRHIAKWDGSSWSGLQSGMPSYGYVLALAVSGNDLYAGGQFSATANGTQAKYVAKWNGSSWSTLGSGMGGSASPYVYALAVSGSTV